MMRSLSKQQGLAAVELAIVTPILVLLLVGIVEIGRMFLQYTMLNKAVQNGARYSLVDIYGAQPDGALATDSNIKNIVVYGKRTGGTVPILPGLSVEDVSLSSTTATHVVVTATYDYTPIFAKLPFTDISLSVDLVASSTLRRTSS
ncbi:hypothetical protein BCT06_01350 [Vibrio breoganii]|uniref:TadE/TadG family type IV pilus assembly protein n=2 Tax=Vibrio breoganii TaxID=553239 RepID=UPI000C820344|nr:TadE family protein [Vibrio breoganii]PMO62653.1 hypothetical protein BCT06_01350 [Vibrio breoganii]